MQDHKRITSGSGFVISETTQTTSTPDFTHKVATSVNIVDNEAGSQSHVEKAYSDAPQSVIRKSKDVSLEVIENDELGPLTDEFLRRRECWLSSNHWSKGNKFPMEKGDYWPGCQPNDVPQSVREERDRIEEDLRKCSINLKKTVTNMLKAYLARSKFLFNQLPKGYMDKEELRDSAEAPRDIPIWSWSEVGASGDCPNGRLTYYGIYLDRVLFRRHFLLRLLKGIEPDKQAIVYVNSPTSVEWVCFWLKSQGIAANFTHNGLLMAHIHWILSEFAMQKFTVLVSSDDHFDFQTFSNHYAGVSHVIHYELPTKNPLRIWNLRNAKVSNASDQSQLDIISFFRKNYRLDIHFKEAVEKSSQITNT